MFGKCVQYVLLIEWLYFYITRVSCKLGCSGTVQRELKPIPPCTLSTYETL